MPLAVDDVPSGVVTVTWAVPADAVGRSKQLICVSLTTKNCGTDTVPNFTAVAPVNPVPVSVTSVPPASVSLLGLTPDTVGPGVRNVN